MVTIRKECTPIMCQSAISLWLPIKIPTGNYLVLLARKRLKSHKVCIMKNLIIKRKEKKLLLKIL